MWLVGRLDPLQRNIVLHTLVLGHSNNFYINQHKHYFTFGLFGPNMVMASLMKSIKKIFLKRKEEEEEEDEVSTFLLISSAMEQAW